MKKIIATTFLSLFAFFFFSGEVKAADLSVTCTSSTCSLYPVGGALFNEANFAPGESVTREIYVLNTNDKDDCNLVLKAKNLLDPEKLSEVLFTVIKSATADIFGESDGISAAKNTKKLSDVFTAGNISLGTVPKSDARNFYWVATFDPDTDNDFQGREAKFDFDMFFTCGVAPLGPSGETTTTVASAPVCNDTTPGVPTEFGAVLGATAGQVALSWAAPALPYTYFLVAYSDNSSWPPKWGNPDVGNVTSYTVSGLGSGTYWFWVRAGNNCQPGGYTGPISSEVISGIPGGGIATGFAPGVLGAETPGELGGSEATATATQAGQTGEVAGIETQPFSWWWLIFPGIGLILFFFYLWKR